MDLNNMKISFHISFSSMYYIVLNKKRNNIKCKRWRFQAGKNDFSLVYYKFV